MDRRTILIYTTGLLQGIALVAFPAVSTILTNPALFHLSSTEYGSLFIPQSLLSILFAFLNPLLAKHFGSKQVLIAGMISNLLSMLLLATSAFAMDNHWLAYWILLIATGCLGVGFGAVVPTINRVAEELYPSKSDTAVLALNALLGLGTALSPLFIMLFTAMGFWWGLPLFLFVGFILLIASSISLKLPKENKISSSKENDNGQTRTLFLVFIASAFLYGIVEALNGNWLLIYMNSDLAASLNLQSLTLTSFWGMVTVGRVLFAKFSKTLDKRVAFQTAPFITTFAFLFISMLTPKHGHWAVLAFGLTGLGCSILLPLIISFGGKQLQRRAPSVPGMIISTYLLGYGFAAFGVGPLQEWGISLRIVYEIGAVISLALGLLALYIVSAQKNHRKPRRNNDER